MEKNQLEQYVTVVEAGSISKAAKILYLAQPNLSKTIQMMEEEMGQKLLLRSHRGVETTPLGKELYYHAKNILERFGMIDEWKTMHQKTLPCYLNVSISSLFLDKRILQEFSRQTQSMETFIQLHETTPKSVLEDLVNGQAELGIVILNDQILPAFQKIAEAKEIHVEVIDRKPYCLHYYRHYHLEKDLSQDLRFLNHYIWIHFPLDFFGYLNASLSQYGFMIQESQKRIVSNNYHAMIQMLCFLDAFIFGNIWQKEEFARTNIASIPLSYIHIQQNFIILTKKREALSHAGILYLKILKEIYQL